MSAQSEAKMKVVFFLCLWSNTQRSERMQSLCLGCVCVREDCVWFDLCLTWDSEVNAVWASLWKIYLSQISKAVCKYSPCVSEEMFVKKTKSFYMCYVCKVGG